jgi:hypothetical protein
MKATTFRQTVPNVYIEGEKVCVDATVWASLEGVNVMMTAKGDQAVKMAASLTWEEVNLLMVALSAAQAN